MFGGLKVAPTSVTALLWRRRPSGAMTVPGTRTAKVVCAIVILLLSAIVAALNVTPLVTAVLIAVATVALYGVIVASGRLERGQVLDPESQEIRLVGEGPTSAGARALFVLAEKSLKIVAGWLGPGIYFNEDVFAACRRIIAGKGEVLIVVAEPKRTRDEIRSKAGAPELWKEFEGWVESGKVSLRRTTVREQPHFAIVDNEHVWDEDKHDPDELGKGARVIYFDGRVRKFKKRFKKLQKQSVPL